MQLYKNEVIQNVQEFPVINGELCYCGHRGGLYSLGSFLGFKEIKQITKTCALPVFLLEIFTVGANEDSKEIKSQ